MTKRPRQSTGKPNTVKHLCGQCAKKFSSLDDYIKHTCKVTGYSPKDPEHFSPISYTIYPAPLAKEKATKLPEKEMLAKVAAIRRTKKQYNA